MSRPKLYVRINTRITPEQYQSLNVYLKKMNKKNKMTQGDVFRKAIQLFIEQTIINT